MFNYNYVRNNMTNQNSLKINIPEGMEIDENRSTFAEIFFKPKEKQLPRTWRDLVTITGYFVNHKNSHVEKAYPYKELNQADASDYNNKNIFETKEQATAALALAQLTQLMKAYNGDWKPNWSDCYEPKYTINYVSVLEVNKTFTKHNLLAFYSEKVADLFLANFKDLIKEAYPLLYGYSFKD